MAALQSFGLLEPTLAFLGSVSFAVGKSQLSILDLVNGIFILLFVLWMSSLVGTAGELEYANFPPPTLTSGALAKLFGTFNIYQFPDCDVDHRADLSSFALLGGAIGVGIGLACRKWFPIW